MLKRYLQHTVLASLLAFGSSGAYALTDCSELPSAADLKAALDGAQAQENGGFGLNMWASMVNRDGEVCAVVFTGDDRGEQWPGSRVISAQKASTANSFSLPSLALSTANLWEATQPGGSLFGLQFSNPVDTAVAYGNVSSKHGDNKAGNYGQGTADPMVGSIVGGVNVFGGGLALYDYSMPAKLLGAVGVSGDSSCADHNIAWRLRDALGMDNVPGGVGGPVLKDNMTFTAGGGFDHPTCTDPDDEADNAVVFAACTLNDGATGSCI